MDMDLFRLLLHGARTVVKLEIPDIIASADLVTTAVGVYFQPPNAAGLRCKKCKN